MKSLFDLELEVHPELKDLPLAEISKNTDKRRLFEPIYKELDVALLYPIEEYPEIVGSIDSELKLMAEQGVAEMYILLGDAFKYGTGVTKDPLRAIKYYETASGKGNPLGNEYLAALFIDDNYLGKDLDRAFNLLNDAANGASGCCKSSFGNYALGNVYYLGQLVEKDIDKALSFFHHAQNCSLYSNYEEGEDPYYWKAIYRQSEITSMLNLKEVAAEQKAEALRIFEKSRQQRDIIEDLLIQYD